MRNLYIEVHSISPSFQCLQHHILLALSALSCHYFRVHDFLLFIKMILCFWIGFYFTAENEKNPQTTKSCRSHWSTSKEPRLLILGTPFTYYHVNLLRGDWIMLIILLYKSILRIVELKEQLRFCLGEAFLLAVYRTHL